MTTAKQPSTVPATRRTPDPVALAVAVATAYVEVRSGRRPARQLDRILTPALREDLANLVCRTRRARPAQGGVSVRRVLVQRRDVGTADVVVVLRSSARWSAVAVRVEHRRTGWIVTALGAPEDR